MYHWPDGAEVQFQVSSGFPSGHTPALNETADAYNELFAKTRIGINTSESLAPELHGNNPESVSGDRVNGIYWITGEWPWETSQPHSDAMTVVLFDQDGILEADIFYRASALDDLTPPPDALATQDFSFGTDYQSRQWVYVLGLHEMGHALGRNHHKDKDSIMYKSINLGFVQSPFSTVDEEIFGSVYSINQ